MIVLLPALITLSPGTLGLPDIVLPDKLAANVPNNIPSFNCLTNNPILQDTQLFSVISSISLFCLNSCICC